MYINRRYAMGKLIASLLFVFITTSFLPASPSPEIAATSLSTRGRAPPESCVSYPTNSLSRRSMVRITNFCPESVFINARVLYRDGTNDLYSSNMRIQPGRFMNIYTDPWRRPVDLNVAYGIFKAEIPQPC